MCEAEIKWHRLHLWKDVHRYSRDNCTCRAGWLHRSGRCLYCCCSIWSTDWIFFCSVLLSLPSFDYLCPSYTLSLSLSLSHTHTHIFSLSLSHTHALSLSLSLMSLCHYSSHIFIYLHLIDFILPQYNLCHLSLQSQFTFSGHFFSLGLGNDIKFLGQIGLCAEMPAEQMLPFAARVVCSPLILSAKRGSWVQSLSKLFAISNLTARYCFQAAANCHAIGARTGLPQRTNPRLAPFLWCSGLSCTS